MTTETWCSSRRRLAAISARQDAGTFNLSISAARAMKSGSDANANVSVVSVVKLAGRLIKVPISAQCFISRLREPLFQTLISAFDKDNVALFFTMPDVTAFTARLETSDRIGRKSPNIDVFGSSIDHVLKPSSFAKPEASLSGAYGMRSPEGVIWRRGHPNGNLMDATKAQRARL